MVYPLYHKHVCNKPATAKGIDIHTERKELGVPVERSIFLPDGTWLYLTDRKDMTVAADFGNLKFLLP